MDSKTATGNESEQPMTKLRLLQAAHFSLTFCNYAMLHATRSAWSLASKDISQEYGFQT